MNAVKLMKIGAMNKLQLSWIFMGDFTHPVYDMTCLVLDLQNMCVWYFSGGIGSYYEDSKWKTDQTSPTHKPKHCRQRDTAGSFAGRIFSSFTSFTCQGWPKSHGSI